jgi:hypothetical protein
LFNKGTRGGGGASNLLARASFLNAGKSERHRLLQDNYAAQKETSAPARRRMKLQERAAVVIKQFIALEITNQPPKENYCDHYCSTLTTPAGVLRPKNIKLLKPTRAFNFSGIAI